VTYKKQGLARRLEQKIAKRQIELALCPAHLAHRTYDEAIQHALMLSYDFKKNQAIVK
jgi:hypothetical protein